MGEERISAARPEPRKQVYAIGLGSNRRHGRLGAPKCVLVAATAALVEAGADIRAMSPVFTTAPVGPSRRAYANAAALIAVDLDPPGLLALLKRIERQFGRRRGQRWSARTLDLDILLWSGGTWHSRRPWLTIPHAALRERRFVLDPLTLVAQNWRVPGGPSVSQLHARLTRPRPAHRSRPRSGP